MGHPMSNVILNYKVYKVYYWDLPFQDLPNTNGWLLVAFLQCGRVNHWMILVAQKIKKK